MKAHELFEAPASKTTLLDFLKSKGFKKMTERTGQTGYERQKNHDGVNLFGVFDDLPEPWKLKNKGEGRATIENNGIKISVYAFSNIIQVAWTNADFK